MVSNKERVVGRHQMEHLTESMLWIVVSLDEAVHEDNDTTTDRWLAVDIENVVLHSSEWKLLQLLQNVHSALNFGSLICEQALLLVEWGQVGSVLVKNVVKVLSKGISNLFEFHFRF